MVCFSLIYASVKPYEYEPYTIHVFRTFQYIQGRFLVCCEHLQYVVSSSNKLLVRYLHFCGNARQLIHHDMTGPFINWRNFLIRTIQWYCMFFIFRQLGSSLAKFQYVDVNEPLIIDRKGNKYHFDAKPKFFELIRNGLEKRLPTLKDKKKDERLV